MQKNLLKERLKLKIKKRKWLSNIVCDNSGNTLSIQWNRICLEEINKIDNKLEYE